MGGGGGEGGNYLPQCPGLNEARKLKLVSEGIFFCSRTKGSF